MIMEEQKKLSKLPYGEGSWYYISNGKIEYKKCVKLNDGVKKRISVRGNSERECLDKMRKKLKELSTYAIPDSKKTLTEAMREWSVLCRTNHHAQTDIRIESIIDVHIARSTIGNMRFQMVTSEQIQKLLEEANTVKNLSYSSIKKIYDYLNKFYRYASAKYDFKNPMLLVNMISKQNVLKPEKEIVFLDKVGIKKFEVESSTRYSTGKIKYRNGFAIAANNYLGLRGSELNALTWDCVDFEKGLVYVNKTVILKKNPDYKAGGDQPKKILAIQPYTKTNKNRSVPLNNKARQLLMLHRENSEFTKLGDYLLATESGKLNSLQNLGKTIYKITKNAGLTPSSCTHITRHSFATELFRKGVKIEVIAKLLGNSVDVCRKTYVHILDEQMDEAVNELIPDDIFDED